MTEARPPSRSRRVIALAVAALLLAGAAWAFWRRGGADEDVSYVTATVERGPVTAIVTATGEVNPVTTVQVGTYVSGPIQAIDVDFNSPVRKGQRVAKIDPAPFQVKVQRAEASLATAQARVAQAKADLELKATNLGRSRRLLGTNVVAQNEYDEARSAHEQAVARVAVEQAGVRQAQAELEEARINLAYTDITSPVDGVVVSRTVDVGQTVAATFQTPTLFLIARNLTEMQVNAAVSESDIGAVRDGQPATFTVDAYPGRDFHGRVTQVRNAPTTVQNVVTYDVVIGVDNPDLALKPGMTATVRIETAHVDDALRLPLRALTFAPPGDGERRRDGDGVWRIAADGALERVAVRPGVRDDTHVAIADGDLAAGDVVALALDKAVGPREGPRIPGVPRFR
ncbi:MAG TPA: efflux RND transporter periplasmic adaptor subunit [Candidatus Dormibacteraeota bacterium]|nr:efflux RND transporter periplasmic adaptor subunit [Candidatus Dormibacteraeota bacterium]